MCVPRPCTPFPPGGPSNFDPWVPPKALAAGGERGRDEERGRDRERGRQTETETERQRQRDGETGRGGARVREWTRGHSSS